MDHREYRTKSHKGIIALVVAGALASTVALAQNPHCTGQGIQVTVEDGILTVSGKVAGLGEEPANAVVTADVTVEILCENPGGNIAPGQTQETQATGEAVILPAGSGQTTFSVQTDPIEIPEDACPNEAWTAHPTFFFGDVTVEFFQEGQEVLAIQCELVDGQFECECLD
jgi:hypothetical protein